MFSNVAEFLKNKLLNHIANVYTYKPIPRDIGELNALGQLADDFELAFINRTGIDGSFEGLGVEDGGFVRLKLQVIETYTITIFRSFKDDARFKNFQDKVDLIISDLAFEDYSSIDYISLNDISANFTFQSLTGSIHTG